MKVLKILLLVLLGRSTVIRSYGNAQQLYCPGQDVELSCRDAVVVVWQGSAFTGQCPNESDTITVIAAQAVVGSTITCGIFIANVSDLTPSTVPGVNIAIVSLTFRADVSLNGTTVQCEDIDLQNILEVDELLDIPATTTPTLKLGQNSQTMVGVAFVIDDARCVTTYHVNVTQEGGPTTSVLGSSSPVIVGDLDVCRYNYRFVGYTTSMTGELSGVSASVNLMVDLTAINGVTVTVNPMDPVIEWTQIDRILYPTCITNYLVTDLRNQFLTITVDSTVTSLTAQQLSAAGFPYCVSIHPTVTPLTPVGSLGTAVGSSITLLINPDFPTPMFMHSFTLTNGTISLQITVQESEVPSRTYQYTNGNGVVSSMMSFTGVLFVINLPGAENGQVIQVTVMFMNGQCSSSESANYTIPSSEISNVTQSETTATSHSVTVTLPLTMYPPEELLIISSVSPPDSVPTMVNFTGLSIKYTVTFNNLKPATDYIFSIRIVLRTDNTLNVVAPVTGTFTTAPIPSVMIISSDGQQMSAPAYTVTLTLPVISYPRSELIIISTLTPADAAPITDDYPLSSQYFVTFHGLNVGVEYSYVIRIVLRRSNSINVSIPLTGSFTIMTSFSTEAFSTGAAVALTFALTFLLTLVLGVSIGALIVLAVNKFRRSEKVTLQTETEMRSPPVIYEEPEAIKPDPLTQGNAAYGEIVY